ncbi:MAG: DUF4105 domain-containing protein [Thiobacillaceae bacterium]|nr:DUF4105 domain-containing protein [Thiobacillaceae bacterium]
MKISPFKWFGLLLLWIVLLGAVAWGSAALWFDGPTSRPLAGLLAAIYALTSLSLPLWLTPRRRAFFAAFFLFAVLLGWWLSLAPSNDRDWQADVAQLPTAEIDGDKLTIRNLRNFDYRSETDYTERWETRSFDLSRLRGWEFDDGQHLAISIETRKEVGESYSAVRGFFRQYELYYVVADERDVIALRTHHRHEDVYLYRLRTPPDRARRMLLDYLETINRLAEKPKWYNALRQNCTTTIRLHAGRVIGGIPRDWRWLANGYLDELLYQYGVINRDLPFAELKSRSHLNPVVSALPVDADFSAAIRRQLPPRPAFTDARDSP